MAKNRYVNTAFWEDPYILEKLDPSEKLLYLYLFTNDKATVSGCYEISLRKIAFETGFDQDTVKKMLSRFETDNKIIYSDGWMICYNTIKNQVLNPKIIQGVKNQISALPLKIKDLIDYNRLSYINTNTNININNNINPGEPEKPNIYLLKDDSTIEEFIIAITQRYFSVKGMYLNDEQKQKIEKWFNDKRFKNKTIYDNIQESISNWATYKGSNSFNFPYLMGIVKNKLGKLWAEHQENKSRLEKKLEMEEIKAGDNGSFGDVFADMNFKLSDKKRELSEKEYGLTDDKLSARKKNIIRKEVTALKLEIEKLNK